jgi:calcineurin-like phosphoesterase family protein
MRFFTSDPHFGHQNIITYCNRPYHNVAQMNADLVARWNSVVTEQDEVVVTGDLAMGVLEESLEWASKCVGNKILVPGNHDRPWKGKKRGSPELYVAAGFTIVDDYEPFTLAGQRVEVSHFPFVTGEPDDAFDDKFAAFRPKSNGQWLIHGHVHNRWHQHGRMINVGVDSWGGYPVAESALAAVISSGPAITPPLGWDEAAALGGHFTLSL